MKPQILISSLYVTALLLMASCNNPEDSDLRSMNLNGDVQSVELITITPIPISEWLYANKYSDDFTTTWAPGRCYSFVGNSKLEFNKHGKVINNIVFDSEGNQIASGHPSHHPCDLYKHFAIDVNELFSSVTKKRDERNRIVEELYTQNGTDRYKRTITYNDNGDIEMVTCNYILLTYEVFGHKMESTDTLKFQYLEFDNQNNWTKARVISDGYIKRNDYSMEVIRHIAYRGESTNIPLINSLQEKNAADKEQNDNNNVTYQRKTVGKNGLSLEVPTNFEEKEAVIQGVNMFQFAAENTDGYFSISVQYSDSSDNLIKEFSSLSDDDYENAMRYVLETNGTRIISWEGRGLTTINGNDGTWCSYYHYSTAGLGGTPVKVEIYQFQDPSTGIISAITFGYDSAHTYLYAPQVEHIKNSIIF